MAQSDEQLLQVVLRARDELTAVAQRAAKALDQTGDAANRVKTPAKGASVALREITDSLQGLPGVGGQAVSMLTNITGKLGGMATAGGIAAASLVVVAGAAVALAQNAAEVGDELGDLSKLTGINVETLSAFRVAAEFADIGLQELGSGLHFLALNLSKAQKEGSETRNVLLAMGFTGAEIKKGMEDPAEFLVLFAQRLDNLKTEADKTTAAQALFGKSSRQLREFLDELAEKGIAGVIAQAKDLNSLWTGEAAESTSKYKRLVQELKVEFRGLGEQIGQWVVPNLLDLIQLFKGEWRPRTLEELEGGTEPPKEGGGAGAGTGAADPKKSSIDIQKRLDELKKSQDAAEAASKAADQARQQAKQSIDGLTKSLTDQATAIVGQIVTLRDGDEAGVRYGLMMKMAAVEAEALKKGVTLSPEVRQQWDDLIVRIVDLTGQLNRAKIAQKQFNDFLKTLDMPDVGQDQLTRKLKEIEAQEESGRQAVRDASAKLSEVFGRDRDKDILAAKQWGDEITRSLKKALEDVPALADEIEAMLAKVPEGVEQKIIESSAIFKTLDGLAQGAFDGIIDSLTGAIEQGKFLNEVLRNMGNSLLLGLNRAVLQAAFAPLQEMLSEVFRSIARSLGGGSSGGNGVWGIVASFLTSVVTGVVGGSVAPSLGGTTTGGAGGPSLGFDSSLPRLAKGGILSGGFTPLNSLAFRLSRMASGGTARGGFRPLTGFAEPPTDPQLANLVRVIHTVSQIPVRAFAGGGIANQATFGLIGEGSFNEAVVPLPDNKSIPVKFTGENGHPGSQGPKVSVQILGDVIPKQPGMSKADVVRIVVDDMLHDGPTRRAVQQHGR